MNRRTSGFTLVEVGIVVPIVMLIAIALFSTLFGYLNSSGREQARLYQSFSQSTALNRIEADVQLSVAFLSTDDTNMSTDSYEVASSGKSTGWGYDGTDGTHRVLMLREYATSTNPLAGARSAVYVKANGAPDCSTAANISGQLTYNIVYFVQNNTLYKRILTDRSSPACSTQYEKLSCPSTATIGTNSCGAFDEIIATNVSGFSVDYYADQSTTTPLDVYNNASLLASARSVNITIENSQKAYNGTVITNSSLRTLSQNQNSGGSN